jgi:hypothetical protein
MAAEHDIHSGVATDAVRMAGDSASREGQALGETARQQAQAMWSDTRESVRSVVSEKQHATASEIRQFAGALRDAARHIEHGGPMARMAEQAAEGLERLSGKLGSKDLDGLVHDVESFARSQPAVFLGMAVAAGFLAARFLKSSSRYSAQPHEGGPAGFSPPGSRSESAVAGTGPAFPTYEDRRP